MTKTKKPPKVQKPKPNKKKKETPNEDVTVIRRSDIPFLKHTLPVGVRIYPAYLKCGDKFVTTMIAHKFPAYLDDLVFADLFNMPGVLITFDVDHSDRRLTIRDIKRSVDELSSRNTVERSSAEQFENIEEQQDMVNLQADVTRSNEQIVVKPYAFFSRQTAMNSWNPPFGPSGTRWRYTALTF